MVGILKNNKIILVLSKKNSNSYQITKKRKNVSWKKAIQNVCPNTCYINELSEKERVDIKNIRKCMWDLNYL